MNADKEERQQDNNGQILSYLSLSCVFNRRGMCNIVRAESCANFMQNIEIWRCHGNDDVAAGQPSNAHCGIQRGLEGPEGLVENSLVGSVGREAIS